MCMSELPMMKTETGLSAQYGPLAESMHLCCNKNIPSMHQRLHITPYLLKWFQCQSGDLPPLKCSER